MWSFLLPSPVKRRLHKNLLRKIISPLKVKQWFRIRSQTLLCWIVFRKFWSYSKLRRLKPLCVFVFLFGNNGVKIPENQNKDRDYSTSTVMWAFLVAFQVGVLTYNNRVTKRFDLKDVESNADFNAKIAVSSHKYFGGCFWKKEPFCMMIKIQLGTWESCHSIKSYCKANRIWNVLIANIFRTRVW